MLEYNKRLQFILLFCFKFACSSKLHHHLNQDFNLEEDISGDIYEGEITERGELKTGESPLAFSQETLERLALNPDIEVNIEVVNENNWHDKEDVTNDYRSAETPFLDYSGEAELVTELPEKFRTEKPPKNHHNSRTSSEHSDDDPCDTWINCRNEFLQLYLRQLKYLPKCPCLYPADILYNDKIWDVTTSKYNRWRDASGDSEKLFVYKPGAVYCIRSVVTSGKTGLAAQHCCYDQNRKLLTRGKGAGTPNLVSPDVSKLLHYEVDIKPWIVCKGDWTRYNRARPPDNRMNCTENPDDEEYSIQAKRAKHY
ncbi:isthmin-1-like [Centruroides sculpturatus]|uniref:isthmin-1-like n=1 Tax=Centruroides sculpturatus TaxID=218467 RepID=UPI000C6E5770|nr:isthmin-1-like [Centruroides sculpturatus]XP_023241384.1 isthmin-1-like [Centruroides sculpturatus]XP_023241385.1 isthmin-1-like [Centruroides sculpturatus]